MAKKKPEGETQPATLPEAEENGGTAGKSKVALVVDLLGEWTEDGKETGSNQALLAELQARYPDREWKMADVTNGKAAAKKAQGGTPKKRTAGQGTRSTTPVKAATTAEPSLSDVRAVAKLAAELGGIAKVSAAIEAIKDINNVK